MFLVARDRLDAALSQVQSAVAIDPASIAARAALGMVWYYTGNQRQAERTFLEVLAIDGRYSQARKGLVRVLLAGKQYPKVLGLLDGWAQGLDRSAGSASSSRPAGSRWRDGAAQQARRSPTSCCPARRRMGKWTPRRCWSRWATARRP